MDMAKSQSTHKILPIWLLSKNPIILRQHTISTPPSQLSLILSVLETLRVPWI